VWSVHYTDLSDICVFFDIDTHSIESHKKCDWRRTYPTSDK